MHTTFPYEGQINYPAYLDAYFAKEEAFRSLPSDAELKELARKSIVREQLVLVPLDPNEAAAAGDTAVIRTESSLPKFHKGRVTVTLGRGLYSKDLEEALIGKKAGESVRVQISGEDVFSTVLELKRRQVPEPTDDMVLALEQKDGNGHLLRTVAEYEEYIRQTKTDEVLANINYYTMEQILADYPMEHYDEEDIRILGELEAAKFTALFREQEGIDLTKEVPKSWEEDMHIHSLAEFIEKRRDWYKMKIRQCLIYLNILGLSCEGATDPLDHYEVLSELQEKMFRRIREELERRKLS
ncbi:MAG: hypothetical protein IJ773_12190 [Lachnospiraceae bacterium]|nr:hypothetical protein [Lachnospiraceae bacterium]